MYGGHIECRCGQQQHVESINSTVQCIACGLQHELNLLTETETLVEEDEEDGTDI